MKLVIKIYLIISFLFYYLYKVVQANMYIAYDIITPKSFANPEFIWIPIRVQSDIEVLLLSNLITMTPGTLTIEVTDDKKKILIHSLYNDAEGKVVDEINEMQNRIMKLTR